MYRIPLDLDLSPIVGKLTSQLSVGQFDLQFAFGIVHFSIYSPIKLIKNNTPIGYWDDGKWPEPAFYDIINTEVSSYNIVNDTLIILFFSNGIERHLVDNSDQYESMSINIGSHSLHFH